jgi:signal transduction histidine kinase/CheY-like chemotaxis protein
METSNNIIVVDDSEVIRETAEKILVDAGYSVTTAGGAHEALSLLSKRQFDLFLLDVVMPDVNGLTLLKELKVYDNPYEAVMMTGHESIDDAATAMEFGAFSYIRKPVKREDLLDHVKKALAMVRVKKNRHDHLRALEEKVRSRTTELEEAVRQLERQGRRIDAIVNSMGEGLLAMDNSDAVVLMNGVAEKIVGVRFGECAGLHVANIDARKEVKEYLLSHTGTMATGREKEPLTVCLDGFDSRHYSVTMQAITDETGVQIGNVHLFVDQTDAAHMETLRNSFLSVAAHELRTPVNIIMNYLALLKTKGEEREMRAVAIEDMRSANNRMKYLVNSIISFINLSARNIPVFKTTIDAGAIIREEMIRLGCEAREKNIRCEVAIGVASTCLNADPHLLRIAVNNLLSNAVKYNRQNGMVRINVKDSLVKGAPGISIDVSDEGEGISSSAMNTLFECFSQGEAPDTRTHSGLGTGLFLTKRAVELLGGEIHVDTSQGRGSRFTIELPVGQTVCITQEKVLDNCQI